MRGLHGAPTVLRGSSGTGAICLTVNIGRDPRMRHNCRNLQGGAGHPRSQPTPTDWLSPPQTRRCTMTTSREQLAGAPNPEEP